MKRRKFIHLSTAVGLVLGLPAYGCKGDSQKVKLENTDYQELVYGLLKEWCDGLIAEQINMPEDPTMHGALYCSACDKIHGRCMDAVYPFLYLADRTGEKKYLDAAIDVMKWSNNVSMPDGSWTVIPNPKSWRGITVFGAIALGEALHHHGHVLPKEIHDEWSQRLEKAAEFIHRNFTISYSHINYSFTAVYALNFLGRMFNKKEYIEYSRALAAEVPNWLTSPNKLIFGENNPMDKPSKKGLLPVDLGYNVEETLNGLVQYAVMEEDEKLLQLLSESMEGHLAFMLPDGAWDNSWGTRQNKWSYWGSRTTDGCQSAFGLMTDYNPAFGTAAYLNTELLKRCTIDGLLAGGLHYNSHGVKPCIHHTFAHAKTLAFILDNSKAFRAVSKEYSIPRAVADGVQHFPEIDVWLAARGPWRATISSYDVVFKKKYSQAATGGSLAVLWHQKVGPIFTASMAEYILAEVNNQQPQPDDEDISLTPRIERSVDGQWFTNLWDLKAEIAFKDDSKRAHFDIDTKLTDRDGQILKNGNFNLEYSFDKEHTKITAKGAKGATDILNSRLVLPVVSHASETIIQSLENKIEIHKENGKVVIHSNVPLSIRKTKKDRVFNMVPGMEAVPVVAHFSEVVEEIICTIGVE